jgi:hypothetical protein
MAIFNQFDSFAFALGGTMNLNSDTINVYLSNDLPAVGDTAYNGVTGGTAPADLATANGYTLGGNTVTPTWSQSGATGQLAGVDTTFTASGGSIGAFQYAVLYDVTTSDLIGWWDYGSAVTLNDTETFTVDFGATIFTVT